MTFKSAIMVKLTPKLISTEFPDQDPQSMQKLLLPGKGIEKIVRLSTCSQLIRLDLSNNSLTSLEGVSQNTTLKWLSAQSNQITSLTGTDSLKQLQVLNLGHNQLSGRLNIIGLPALRALMLNDNRLTGVDGLGACPDLNTVILKQNQITHLGQSLHGCTALAKLSVANNKSGCRLKDVGSTLSECSSLAELRVSHNALASLPQDLSRNPRLKIIEAGANQIADFQQIQVLSQLPSLHQLNLRGCPIADMPDYQAQLLQQLPMLDVLDSKKVPKSGIVRSAKPALALVPSRPKQSAGSQALDKAAVPTDGTLDDSYVKSQKRPLRNQAEEPEAPKLKKARKDSLVASTDATEITDGKGAMTAAAPRFDDMQSDGDNAEVVKEAEKPEKKRKAKAGKKSQQQAAAAGSSRGFLADVLDPAKSDVAAKPTAKADGQQKSVANATAAAGDAKASGLVKVVDVQRKTKSKQAKHGKGVDSKSEKNKASGVSGSSAADLLQTGLGLDALQVGLGGSGAWD